MNDVWTIAEQYNGKLKAVSFELLARGRALADKLRVKLISVLIGDGVAEDDLRELILRGADEVYAVQDWRLKDFVCESYTNILLKLIAERKPQIILAAATSSGRTLMPCVAVKARTGLTADCTGLDIEEGTGLLLQPPGYRRQYYGNYQNAGLPPPDGDCAPKINPPVKGRPRAQRQNRKYQR